MKESSIQLNYDLNDYNHYYNSMGSIYDHVYINCNGRRRPMYQYRGKVLLIVNTATRCSFASQFRELEELHQRYAEHGLVIIAFPCNQFRNQEPEDNQRMVQVCGFNYGVQIDDAFQISQKTDVNGSQTHPIFKFLKDELGGFLGRSIKWNFTKFLVGRDGTPYKRYSPTTGPLKLDEDIRRLLGLKV